MATSRPVRMHVMYGRGDPQPFAALRRHLSSLLRAGRIQLSHSAEFSDDAQEAHSDALQAAEIFLFLCSDSFFEASADLRERLRRIRTTWTQPETRVLFLSTHGTAVPTWLQQDLGFLPISIAAEQGKKGSDSLFFDAAKWLQRAAQAVQAEVAASDGMLRGATPARGDVVPLSGLPKKRYAVLVGVNYYFHEQAFPPLNFCVNDVRTLAQTLESAGYSVVCLHDENRDPRLRPVGPRVQATLAALCEGRDPEDLILVHFACHGFVQDNKQYLALCDTDPRRIADTAISLSAIEAQLKRSAARRRVLILDACHSGVSRGTRSANIGISEEALARYSFEQAEGFVRIAASTEQQKAQEWRDQKMGAFSYFLNQALQGTDTARNQLGFVTVQSAANYVLANLRDWSFKNLGLRQEPTIQYEGLGELVLVDLRDSTKKESA